MELFKKLVLVLKKIIQILAFFVIPPFNIWLHKLAGAKIGKHVGIHPFVLILANEVKIGDGAKIRLGTILNIRSFHIGKKSTIGYFTLVKGESDFHMGDASLIGIKTSIQCSRAVNLGHYAGVGPNSVLMTHGSFLPASEGYPAKFGPIILESKTWLCMNTIVGPGVTIGKNSIILPGTVVSKDVKPNSLVTGDPACLKSVPIFPIIRRPDDMELFAANILKEFCNWSNEYKGSKCFLAQNALIVNFRKKQYKISVNDDGADIVIYTEAGKNRHKMYFNIADLATDGNQHPLKIRLENFMKLYYGLIFI